MSGDDISPEMDLILEPVLLTTIHTTTHNNPEKAGRKKILEQMRT